MMVWVIFRGKGVADKHKIQLHPKQADLVRDIVTKHPSTHLVEVWTDDTEAGTIMKYHLKSG